MTEKTFYIETYGCQMNIYDSNVISDLLLREGYTVASDPSDANLILINTCSVRDRAERKALSRIAELSTLKRRNPETIIGVIGCMAQRLGARLTERDSPVDLVLGPDSYAEIVAIANQLQRERTCVINVSQDPARLYSPRPQRYDSVTAFVTIMRGCDNFCSYCVVPYVRGRERSKPHREILKEVKHLVGLGVKEITLIGQNVNSYRDDGMDFAALLEMVNEVEDLERIRFCTSHPKDVTPRVIDCMRDLPKVCEHLHLPLQSGSDRILSLMNRCYTYEDYKRVVQLARDRIAGLAVTTDIMVGFPTETEADHHATLRAIEEIGFESAFMFKYSARHGTRAARFEDDIPETEKLRRLNDVIRLENAVVDEKKRALIGTQVEILLEGKNKREPGFLLGRTRKNWLAKLPLKGVSKGEVVVAEVTGATRWMIACDKVLRKVGT